MKDKIRDVTELEVFKYAHELTLKIYDITMAFPKEEVYGLIPQMRRSAYSICANLMEGSYRNNTKEFKQFCGIARGSCGELRYFLLLAKDLEYINQALSQELIEQTKTISKMLYGIIRSLDKK